MKAMKSGTRVAASGEMESGWTVHPKDDGEEMLPDLDDWLAPDEIEQIGDVGGNGDDHEGPEQARMRWLSMKPREFFLLSRMDEAIKQFKAAIAKRRSGLTGEARVPDEEWRRLGDEALGLVRKEPVAVGSRRNERDLSAVVTDEFNRDIAVLKEVVLLETRVAYEIGMAKHHMERAMESTRAITRLTFEAGKEQRVLDEEWLASARSAFGQVNDHDHGAGKGWAGSPMEPMGHRIESKRSDAPEPSGLNAWWATKTAETADFEHLSRLLAVRAASALALIQSEPAPRKS